MTHRHTFQIGDITGHIFTDGTVNNKAANMFATAPQDTLQQALATYHLQPDSIPVFFNMALLETPTHKMMLDTGIGHQPDNATHGFLYENLAQLNIKFEAIDTVILSHAHSDHISANTDAHGNPLFPNADYLIWHSEWDYWTHPDTLRQADMHTTAVRRNLLGIQDRFQQLTDAVEIVDGVQIVPAFGHTVGHIAVHVQSENQHFIYTADAFHHPLHITHPDWVYYRDVNFEQSHQSRLRLLELAADTNALFTGYHMQFPALGRITRTEEGYQWHSVTTNS